MKIFIIQISDIHCKSNFDEYRARIEASISAIGTLGEADGIIFVCSGDLTNKGSKNEFKIGRKIIGCFINKLSEKFNVGYIRTLIVPGNHDMIINRDDRSCADIVTWNKDDHIDDELYKLTPFFEYANSKKCFLKNKLCETIFFDINGYKIGASIFNSALFSTLEKDNKELHYIPQADIEKTQRTETEDLHISIMHHSYEWFDWKIKDQLIKKFQKDDIVFFGHDHKAETISLSNGNGETINMVLGGEFSLNENPCAFNVVTIDTEKKYISTYKFSWIEAQNMFIARKQDNSFHIKGNATMKPTEEYIEKISTDSQKLSDKFTDYYVFPKLKTNSEFFNKESENIDMDNIFDVLQKNKVIAINGKNQIGKSAMIKNLYIASVEKGLYPLLIEPINYRDSRIEKMIKDMVELQYGDNEYIYDQFKLINPNKVVMFIDDFDLISNAKSRENLFTYILKNNYLLVYSARDYMSQELTTLVKEKIQNSNIDTLEIQPFYKSKRDELVKKICGLNKQTNNNAVINSVTLALDYMVQSKSDLFSLTPCNLAQYIKYFINNSSGDDKGTKTISVVFETNIRNAIIENTSPSEVGTFLSALEYLAQYMYFEEKTDVISSEKLSICISEFNTKRKARINAKIFSEKCCKANILTESYEAFSFSFCDKNTFAYFIAKYVNLEIEKDPNNREHINFIMNHICFGINDIIVLFLSYVRSNSRILIEIASKAVEILKDDEELDFDEKNIPFIFFGREIPKKLPTKEDKEFSIKQTEQIEEVKHETVRFRGLFDYPEDIEKKQYQVARALKFTQIIGRALVDQYGSLECDEITKMVDELYSTTQKILFAVLKPYQDNYSNIVEELSAFIEEHVEITMTKEDVMDIFNKSAVTLILNIMNDIAYNSASTNTISALSDIDLKNTNYKIQNLMMYENAGNTEEFVSKAVDLYKDFKSNPFAKNLVSRIAYKHILHTENIARTNIDRLISANILNENNKKQYLLNSAKNSESQKA